MLGFLPTGAARVDSFGRVCFAQQRNDWNAGDLSKTPALTDREFSLFLKPPYPVNWMAQHCTARARWCVILTWPIRAFWRWCIKLACVRHSLIYRFRPGTDEASPDRNVRCVRHGHNAQPMHGLITHHAKRWLGHVQHSRLENPGEFIGANTRILL